MNFISPVIGKNYAAWISRLKKKSGVYTIKQAGFLGEVLYVGESHTSRLKDTLTRHFRKWKGPQSGPTYRREEVLVSVAVTSEKQAVDLQNELIRDLRPRDNIAENKPIWEK
jgi:excinuclease UvrABC nuclease subunit